MLEEALALHAQGRLAEAEQAYRTILAQEPDNADVGHQLGLLALDAGMPQAAAPIFERVCMLAPDNAAFQANRGLALMQSRQLPQALAAFDHAIALQPDLFQAHLHRGMTLRELRRPDEALATLSRATALRDDPAAHNLAGLLLDELGRYDEALESFRHALDLNPENAMAQSNYAHALVRLRRFDEALVHFEKAVAQMPGEAGMHYNLAEPLKMLGRLDDALAAYDRAIALAPEMANAHINRGLLVMHQGRFADALAALDRAIALEPDSIGAHIGRSQAIASSGDIDAALTYNRELAKTPRFQAEADFLSAMLHMHRGEWEQGWTLYEARRLLERYTDGDSYPSFAQAEWRGEGSLEGKTLYVHGEQGLGDHIQFARYLALARRAGAQVIFSPRDVLVRLFTNQGLADEVLPLKTAPKHFDLHMPLASMPMAFGTRLDKVPAEVPYLHAEAPLVEKWRTRLGQEGFKIGVCWAGAFDPVQGSERSYPLAQLAALAALPGVRLISLQKKEGLGELDNLPAGMMVENLGEDFDAGDKAFVDAAAVMASLDLVISCDTSIAHLAGALGRPVWTALKRHPEWRWGDEGETSPWYPTMTLFRQKDVGDWTPVFTAMRERLAAMTGKA